MNHSGFKGLNTVSVVGSRIPGDGQGFDWRAGVGRAGLWVFKIEVTTSEAGGSHRKVFKNMCDGGGCGIA